MSGRKWLRRILALPRVHRAVSILPEPVRRLGRRLLAIQPRVRWGRLRRLQPLSDVYGFDRGLPIDRHYIAQFMQAHASDIRGRILEVRDPEFASRFGRGRVGSVDLLDIDPSNTDATIVADLSEAGSLREDSFDCFILTQTLQLVPDPWIAIENAIACLAPGGVLLLSAPSISRLDPTAGRDNDLWRFTAAGLRQLITTAAPSAGVSIASYGNALTGSAFLMGLASQELRERELAYHDPDYPLLVCARVVKG